ncbi:MAG: hypothetical protein Q8932_15100 [Bacteroidota bacterium]|nr:hypothetical protein [Bacteroidota bacterium]
MHAFPARRMAKRYLQSLLIIIAMTLISCVRPDFQVNGSVDLSNEHEGGASALTNGDDLGYNVACGVLSSLPVNMGHPNLSSDDAMADADVDAGFGIYSQLEFIRKGSKFQDTHTHLNYLDLSGHVVYYKKMPDNRMIFGGLGPYIAHGLSGKASGNGFSENVFGVQDGYKRFDAGVSLVGQYRLPNTLSFGLGYEWALVNKSSAPDFTSRNRTLYFSVGYSLTKLLNRTKK